MRLLELSPVQYRKVRTLAKYSNTVEYQIRTTLDSSGLAKLKAELASLTNLTKTKAAQGLLSPSAVQKTLGDIRKVEAALTKAFNPRLGMMNSKSLFGSLGPNLNSIYKSFSNLGPQGVRAFSQVYGQIGKIDTGMKRISSTSDKIMNTFGNTFRWGMIASVFSGIMNSIHQSAQYVKDLDKSLTNIQMVTAATRDTMNDFAVQANEAAKRLGGTTVQMTNATEVFIRQGHSLQTSTQLGEYAVHLANVSQQDSAAASDEITAYMNAFKIPLGDLGNAVSKWAAVANNAAVSVEELSVASQKAASVANTVGVDMDQFAGHIAAIEATTREAPENIGNGLKTLYSRIADVKLGETLEDGVDMGAFAKAIEKVGVEVLDSAGKLRNAGDIIEDLMVVWQDLDQTQRAALAKTVAGRFQLARFEALMNSADIYEKSVGVSREETGTTTYDRMQETYKESMEGRLNTLHATIEGIFTKAFNTDDFYGMIDAATKLAETFDNLVQAMGGGGQAVLAFTALITRSFSEKIGRGLTNVIENRMTNNMVNNNRQVAANEARNQLAGKGLVTNDARLNELANNRAKITQYAPVMNNEQLEKSNTLWQKTVDTFGQLIAAEDKFKSSTEAVKLVLSQLGFTGKELNTDLIGLLKTIEAGGSEAKITAETLKSIGTEEFISKLKNMQTEMTQLTVEFEKTAAAGKGWDSFMEKADKVGLALRTMGQAAGFSEEKMSTMLPILKDIETVLNGDGVATEKFGKSVQETNLFIEQLAKGLSEIVAAGGISSETLERQQASATAAAQAYRALGQEALAMSSSLSMQSAISGLTNLASAGMTAVFAVQSLTNIVKILDNEDLTIGQKAEQLAMNFAMVAALGIPAITQTMSAVTTLREAMAGWQSAQAAMIVTEAAFSDQMALNIALRGDKVRGIVQEAAVQGNLNREYLEAALGEAGYSNAQAKRITTQVLALKLEEKGLKVTKANILSQKLLTTTYGKGVAAIAAKIVATLTETGAEEGATGAKKKGAAASLILAAAEKIAAGESALLVASIVPLAAATLVIVGVVAWLRHLSKEEEARKERIKAQAEASNELIEKIRENKDSLEELYNNYKFTGQASDEFKEALLEQAEALDIVGAKTLIAQGEYEKLKEKIDEATVSALEYNNILLQNANNEYKIPGVSGTLGLFGDNKSYEAMTAAGIDVTTTNTSAGTSYGTIANNYEVLLKYQEQTKENQDEINRLEAERQKMLLNGVDVEDKRYTEIEDEIEKLEEFNATYSTTLDSEEAITFMENQDKIIANTMDIISAGQDTVFNSWTENAGDISNVEDLQKAVESGALGSTIQEKFASLGDEAARAFLLELATQLSEANLSNVHLSLEEIELESNFDAAAAAWGEKFGEDQEGKEEHAQNFKRVFEGNVDFQNLSNEDKNVIYTTLDIDEVKSIDELEGKVNNIISRIQNGEDLQDILVDINPEFSDEDWQKAVEGQHLSKSEWQEKLDIEDEGTFDLIIEDYERSSNEIQQWKDDIDDSIKKTNELKKSLTRDNYKDVVKGAKSYESALKALNEDLEIAEAQSEDYNEVIDDLAGKYTEGTEGLSTIVEKMEDWNEALESGNEKDRATALQEMSVALGQLTHTDSSNFDTEFILTNLDDIKLAAEGDIDAISRLRMAAAEKILVDADFADSTKELPERFTSFLSMMQGYANDASIEIGAKLNYPQVIAGFKDILDNAQMTAQQVNAFLDAIEGLGITANVDYETISLIKNLQQSAAALGEGSVMGAVQTAAASALKADVIKNINFRKTGDSGSNWANNTTSGAGSGGGGGGGCFIAGTLITTLQHYYKNIEDIEKDDIVLSYNEKLKKNEYSKVLETMIHIIKEKIYNLYIEDEILIVTGIHRFFVLRNNIEQWIAAADLKINDQVLFADGTWHNIQNIESEIREETVYNFEVSGNHNYYVGKNQILAHNKGGGGGGGKGKSYEPKKKDYEAKEKDRYEKVNTAIDELDSSINNLTMDQDRLFGNRWLDNLKEETSLLKEQVPWYKEKLKIQKAEAKELRDQLGKDFGAKFGNNGQLQNYAQIFDQLEKERKAAYDKYNAATTEEGQKAAEEAIKNIEDRQSSFEKLYQRYDTLWSKDIPATEKSLKDIQDRLEDIAEEARKARREAAQELDEIRETSAEIEKTYANLTGEHPDINFDIDLQRLNDLIDPATGQAEIAKWIKQYKDQLAKTTDKDMKKWLKEQIAALQRAQETGTSALALNMKTLNDYMKQYEQWQKTGKSDLWGENEQAMLEALQEELKNGSDLISKIQDQIENMKDDLQDMQDMLDDTIDDRKDNLDAIGDKIEHIQSMSELIYGEQASAQQVNLLNMQAKNEENRLKLLEKEKAIQSAITEAKREIAEADPNNKTAQEEYLDALDKERDIDKDILDTREKITEAYKDAKEAANDLAVDNWLKNFDGMINGVSIPLEYMADQWERIKENEDLYLDDLNKAYEIQKLSNKYQQLLNDATDPKVQQKITDQMKEQLAYLNEKTNLSKYDVEYANAQLEILQKTIALEDARNAKNQMKLRRDSQGNYQYVYAANQNKTAEAENDLLDASMNAYNMSKEQQADVQDSYIKKVQDMADALRKAANDSSLSEEQIGAITRDIIDMGHEYLEAMGEQLTTSQKNMIESFIDTAEQLQAEYAEGVKTIAEELKENTERGLDDVADTYDTFVKQCVENEDLIREASDDTREEILSNLRDFEVAVGEANINVAVPLDEMQMEFDDVDESIQSMTDSMGELFNLLEQKSGAILQGANAISTLQSKLTDANNDLSEYVKQLRKLEDQNKKQQTVIAHLENVVASGGSGSGGGKGSGSSGGTGGKDPGGHTRDGKLSPGDYATLKKGHQYMFSSYGDHPVGDYNAGIADGVIVQSYSGTQIGGSQKAGSYYVAIHGSGKNGANTWQLGWVKPSDLEGYDTGGYTGNWDNSGRLAMLHQKELVLNAQDTQNILAAVDAVRVITEQLKSSAFVGNITNTVGRASQNNIQGSNVEQRVEITANFPNANSAEEIEKALLSISDRSYQYAYNKNDIPW